MYYLSNQPEYVKIATMKSLGKTAKTVLSTQDASLMRLITSVK